MLEAHEDVSLVPLTNSIEGKRNNVNRRLHKGAVLAYWKDPEKQLVFHGTALIRLLSKFHAKKAEIVLIGSYDGFRMYNQIQFEIRYRF